jgi:hypothetical protein
VHRGISSLEIRAVGWPKGEGFSTRFAARRGVKIACLAPLGALR